MPAKKEGQSQSSGKGAKSDRRETGDSSSSAADRSPSKTALLKAGKIIARYDPSSPDAICPLPNHGNHLNRECNHRRGAATPGVLALTHAPSRTGESGALTGEALIEAAEAKAVAGAFAQHPHMAAQAPLPAAHQQQGYQRAYQQPPANQRPYQPHTQRFADRNQRPAWAANLPPIQGPCPSCNLPAGHQDGICYLPSTQAWRMRRGSLGPR